MPLLFPTESEAANPIPIAAPPQLARTYHPRDPSESALVTLLRDHLDAFLDAADSDDPTWRLPAFVERELRAIIPCGDLNHGFVRLKCTACRGPRVVPFSCKGRLCPSCAGRRMNEQAAHLVDRVLPKIPYRQFRFEGSRFAAFAKRVLTLPGELARVVAFDAELASLVFGVFADEVARWQCAVARAAGIDRPEAGCVLEFAEQAQPWRGESNQKFSASRMALVFTRTPMRSCQRESSVKRPTRLASSRRARLRARHRASPCAFTACHLRPTTISEPSSWRSSSG